jgi:transcriptional regulator with XRE-family HTH domain
MRRTQPVAKTEPRRRGHPVPDQFAARLRALRIRKGLTQRALGWRCGFTGQMVSMLETGRKKPSEQTQRHLAKALGVSREELCGPAHSGERDSAGK